MPSKVIVRTSVVLGLVGIFTACGLNNSASPATDNRSTTGTTTTAGAAPTSNVSSTSADATTAGVPVAAAEQVAAPSQTVAAPVTSPVTDSVVVAAAPAPAAAAAPAPVTTAAAPVVAAPAAPADTKDVDFHITAGTAKEEWNTAANPVKVKVGQVLHVYNDDTIAHRMHTFGTPCPHGDDIAPGAVATCTIATPIDTVAKPGLLYDHDYGTTALFYLQATAN